MAEASNSDTWILPFVSQVTESPSGEVNLIKDNIELWKHEVWRLIMACPPDDTPDRKFAMWKSFLVHFRDDHLPTLQSGATEWAEDSLMENMRKLHQELSRTILTELTTSVINECHKGLHYASDRLSDLNSLRHILPIHRDNLDALKNDIQAFREWCFKTIVQDVENPNKITECVDRWNTIYKKIDEFQARVNDRSLPEDASYPKSIDFHELLLAPYGTVTAAVGVPSGSSSAISSRFDSAAIFVKTQMKKLEQEFVQPLCLALNGTVYESTLDKILHCYEKQDDLAQTFSAECLARAEMVREGCVEDKKEEDNAARLAYSEARALINDILTTLRSHSRNCLLRLYVQVLDDMQECVVKLEGMNTNHRIRRRLEERKAVKKHWRKYFMGVMKGLRSDTSIPLITNLKETHKYFQTAVDDSASVIDRFWAMIKPSFFI